MEIKGTFEEWADTWVRSAGCDQLEVQNGNSPFNWIINQTPYNLKNTPENKIRRQKIKVASFDQNLAIQESVDVVISCENPQTDFTFKAEPFAILLNYQAHGYGKFFIDEKSLKSFEMVPLKNITCRLTRKQIYNILFDMTITGAVAGSRVLALCIANMEDEQAEEILNDLIKATIPVLIKKYVPSSSISKYN